MAASGIPARKIFLAAVLTGLFCAVFAMVVDWITDMLGYPQLIAISFVSGFLGSLFASFVLRRTRE